MSTPPDGFRSATPEEIEAFKDLYDTIGDAMLVSLQRTNASSVVMMSVLLQHVAVISDVLNLDTSVLISKLDQLREMNKASMDSVILKDLN
jgi:hypothetical protein